jgi:hypothetical protein
MSYVRAEICIIKQSDILKLLSILSESEDKFTIENFDGSRKVNARSIMGVLYITAECGAELFLVNNTHDGVYPPAIDDMRVWA